MPNRIGFTIAHTYGYSIPIAFVGKGSEFLLGAVAVEDSEVSAKAEVEIDKKPEEKEYIILERLPKEIDKNKPYILGYVVCFNPKEQDSLEEAKEYVNQILALKPEREGRGDNGFISIALVSVSSSPDSGLTNPEEGGDISMTPIVQNNDVVENARLFANQNGLHFFNIHQLDKTNSNKVISTIARESAKVLDLKPSAQKLVAIYQDELTNRFFKPSEARQRLLTEYLEDLYDFEPGNEGKTTAFITKIKELIRKSDELHQKENLFSSNLLGSFSFSSFSATLKDTLSIIEAVTNQTKESPKPSAKSSQRPG